MKIGRLELPDLEVEVVDRQWRTSGRLRRPVGVDHHDDEVFLIVSYLNILLPDLPAASEKMGILIKGKDRHLVLKVHLLLKEAV